MSLALEQPRTVEEAWDEARLGRWAAGWYLFGYPAANVRTLGLLSALHRSMSPGPAAFAIVVGFVALSVVLVLTISLRQARWASLLLFVWTLYECAKTSLSNDGSGLALPANGVCALLAARSLRGSFALARLKRNDVVSIFN